MKSKLPLLLLTLALPLSACVSSNNDYKAPAKSTLSSQQKDVKTEDVEAEEDLLLQYLSGYNKRMHLVTKRVKNFHAKLDKVNVKTAAGRRQAPPMFSALILELEEIIEEFEAIAVLMEEEASDELTQGINEIIKAHKSELRKLNHIYRVSLSQCAM